MKKEVLGLALGVAILPPLWAIFSEHIGLVTGSVAMICAGVYGANGNKVSDGVRISLGFLAGDLWAVLAILMMGALPFGHDISTFVTLFVLGAFSVAIACKFEKAFFLPAWLCGWAIGMAFMGSLEMAQLGNYAIQMGISMLVGVWYVGWGISAVERLVGKRK